MIHTILGFSIIIMATVCLVDTQRFYLINYFLLTVNIIGGVASVVKGVSGNGD